MAETEPKPINDVPRCKNCNSTDIYRDDLVCQTVKTKDLTVFPLFICKGCEGGMIVANEFKEFVKKVLTNVNKKPIVPDEKKDNHPASLS